jgi:hypothetical protein
LTLIRENPSLNQPNNTVKFMRGLRGRARNPDENNIRLEIPENYGMAAAMARCAAVGAVKRLDSFRLIGGK